MSYELQILLLLLGGILLCSAVFGLLGGWRDWTDRAAPNQPQDQPDPGDAAQAPGAEAPTARRQ